MRSKKLYVFVTFILVIFCVIGLVVVVKNSNKSVRPFTELNNKNVADSTNKNASKDTIFDKVLGVSDVATTTQQENSKSPANNDNSTDTNNKQNSSGSKPDSPSNSSDKNDGNDSNDSNNSDSISPTPTPTQDLFAQKLAYISTTVDTDKTTTTADTDSQPVSPSNYTDQQITQIFLPDLVDFFGTDELKKIFENVIKINFTNLQVSDNEATATAVLQLNDNTITTYKTYFYLKNGDWYLYKTKEL